MKKTCTRLIIAVCGLLLMTHASANDDLTKAMRLVPNLANGKHIFRLCANCHMDNGWGKINGSFPVIAGQHRNVLIKQLEDIRLKNRHNPTMFPFTEPGTIGGLQGIADVTAYIATLPADPSPGQGTGEHIQQGETIFKQRCQSCHGAQAEGNNEAFFPRLKGQHYAYLLRQLEWIQSGYRKNVNPAMIEQVKHLSPEDLAAVADYLSRL